MVSIQRRAATRLAATALPNGACAILVDPGAWANIGGRVRVKKVAKAAAEAGHHARQRKLDTPLRIQGVGKDTNTGEWEVCTPIAVPVLNGADEVTTELFDFVCPAIDGPGEGLPLIFGLKSMSEMSGIFDMEQGKRTFTFPVPKRI